MKTMEEYDKIVARAEMLASMNCLVHHLKDDVDRERWAELAMPERFDWHVIKYERSAERRADYMEEAEKMTDREFACVVKTFADLVRSNFFRSVFMNAFTEEKK